MSSLQDGSFETIEAVRSGVGLFARPDRGLIEVTGEDRVRWLDGMISGDVSALESAGSGAGCYATLLTNRGAIVADLHVGLLGERFYLESQRDAIGKIIETLDRFIIADDVTLRDCSDEFVTQGIEGPAATRLFAALTGIETPVRPESWGEAEIAGVPVLWSGIGATGFDAITIRCAAEAASDIEAALESAGEAFGLVQGDREALEVMRVEAGLPLLGAELDEEVLPAEARLDRAIATDKGCYVGQEIVARVRARGKVNHLLVGLRFEAGTLPEAGASLIAPDRETGEVTSVVLSPALGPIGLGYVRRDHAEAGTRLECGGVQAEVTALPFRPVEREGFAGEADAAPVGAQPQHDGVGASS